MKKRLKYIAVTFTIAFGLISGSVLNGNYAEAQSSDPEVSNCDNTGCGHDQVNGVRCFGVGDQASTCDNSDYPDGCSQDAC